MAGKGRQPGVFVQLGMSKRAFKAIDKQKLNFTLTNESDGDMQVLKWNTPLEGFKSDMFHVVVDGQRVPYIGKLVKRAAPTAEDYITIPAGQSVTHSVPLEEGYDIASEGVYAVDYKIDKLHAGTATAEVLKKSFLRQPIAKKVAVRANTAIFTMLEAREAKTIDGINKEVLRKLDAAALAPKLKKAPVFTGCTAARQATLNTALTNATNLANAARLALAGANHCEQYTGQRYREWLGAANATRYSTVLQHYANILNALNNQTITFNCNCTDSDYAYVYADKPYEVFLCNAFWTAPALGTDSRAGTLIHELSHFNVVAGTDDNVYGQANCRNLAKTDPAKAIDNAD